MAFELTTELESGVTGNYWKMLSATVACIDVPVVTVYMELYVSRDLRLAGKSPIKQVANTFPMSSVDMSISYDFRVCLYQTLKTFPEWENAVDIFDDPNKVPVALPVTVLTDYNTAKTIKFAAYDNFNLPITYSISTQPTDGSITENNGVFTYTPDDGFYGSDIAKYTVSNGLFTCDPTDISIEVTDTPDRPSALSLSTSTNINESVVLLFTGSDPNNLPLTYSIVDNPSNGTVSFVNSEWVYVPNNGFYGNDSMTYSASNGSLVSEPVSANVVVIDVLPKVNDISSTTIMNQAVDITANGTDPQSLSLTYSIVSNPTHGTVTLVDNIFTYTPTQDYLGLDSFTYSASNGTYSSDNATVNITVSEV